MSESTRVPWRTDTNVHRATWSKVALCFALLSSRSAAATPLDDVQRGLDLRLGELRFTIDGDTSRVGNFYVAKEAGSLNFTVNTRDLGLPLDLALPFTGTRTGSTIVWRTTVVPTPSISIAPLTEITRIEGVLVASAAPIPGGLDARCGGAPCPHNVELSLAPGSSLRVYVNPPIGPIFPVDASNIAFQGYGGVPRPVLESFEIDQPSRRPFCARSSPRALSARVTLNAPAPSGGAFVDLRSTNTPNVRTVGVLIPEGRRSADFPIIVSAAWSGAELVTAAAGGAALTHPVRIAPASACDFSHLFKALSSASLSCVSCLTLRSRNLIGDLVGTLNGAPTYFSAQGGAYDLSQWFSGGTPSLLALTDGARFGGDWLRADGQVEAFVGRFPLQGDLKTLGAGSRLAALSPTGVAVGTRLDPKQGSLPFVYNQDGLLTIPAPGFSPVGVNDLEQAAGDVLTANGKHAARYQGGALQDLGDLGGGESHATALSAAGDVVGWSRLKGGAIRAFLAPAGGGPMFDLGVLPGYDEMRATSVNGNGHVVGTATSTKTGETRAFFYSESTGLMDLNAVLDAPGSTVAHAATAINDHEDVLVRGALSGKQGEFVLVPTN